MAITRPTKDVHWKHLFLFDYLIDFRFPFTATDYSVLIEKPPMGNDCKVEKEVHRSEGL